MPHKVIDSRFRDLIDEFAPVDRVGRGFGFIEGPVWHPQDQHLLFSDMPGDVRRRWTPDGRVEEVARPTNKGNGMTRDAELNLLVCEHSTSSVVRIRPDGTREVLCSHFEGKALNSPNDICVKSDGSIYFTDPTYGRMAGFGVERPQELSFQGVYMLPPQHKPGDEPVLVSDRFLFTQPNGLTFSPCERFMWVNDSEQANIRLFDIAGDGRLTRSRLFATGIEESGRSGVPDGMRADRDGNLWVTGPGGLWVYDVDGVKLGEVSCPETVANFHWGGADWGTLFMCATTSLYTVRTKARPRSEPFMEAGPAAAPRPGRPAGEGLDPARTALIIQDMQNDTLAEGGAFADSGAPEHARRQNVVENIRRLAAAARRAGVMVIHVWFICEKGHPATARIAPLYDGLVGADALVRGTWGAAPVPGLEPEGADLVVEKMSMSAWETSRLETYLLHAGIDTIINTGAWTNMSVEHTARTAADKGFRVIVPADACSTMNADWQRASIDYAMANVAQISRTDDVIATLS